MTHPFPAFAALFSPDEIEGIRVAPMFSGRRHPIWVPLFGEDQSLRDGHHRLEQSVRVIVARQDGKAWLARKKPKLLDQDDVSNASSAMAEIRAFGALTQAGFHVTPVVETDEPTPDFLAAAGDQVVACEVATKLQAREQDDLQERIHDAALGKGPVPEGVGHNVYHGEHATITMFESVHQPFGRPNPARANDSVQTNTISRVCRIKDDERQLPPDMAAVLVIDFHDTGGSLMPRTLIHQTAPMIAGRVGFTSGALWYAFYGWNGAPVFEGDELFQMGHDGRFWPGRDPKSNLSAALLVMPGDVVCFENQAAAFPLTENTRLQIARFPRFDLGRSVLEWERGDVRREIELRRHMIARLEARFQDIRWG